MESILIFCPDALAREVISHHLIDVGNFHLLFAQTDQLVVSVALCNKVKLVLLFDPDRTTSMIALKDFLREKRAHMRVRLLPDKNGYLMGGWKRVIDDALKPVRPRKPALSKVHPRFKWKPET